MVTLLNAAHNKETKLNGGITNNAVTLVVDSSTGFPSTPFGAIIDGGGVSEESILVTNVSGTTWTIVRAKDGTGVTPDTTGYAHSDDAKVENDVSALYFTTLNTQITGHVHTGSDGSATIFDATAPVTQAFGDAAAAGSATIAARRDHRHGMPSFATPAIVLGTAAAAGSATTPIRSDATILAFDSTAPVTQAFGDAAAAGSAAIAAKRDHRHGMPSDPNAVTTAIHGLTTGTAVLGSKTVGEYVQKGAATVSFGAGGAFSMNNQHIGTTISYAVAYSATPAVVVGGVSNQAFVCSSVNPTNTGFGVWSWTNQTSAFTGIVQWAAIGA